MNAELFQETWATKPKAQMEVWKSRKQDAGSINDCFHQATSRVHPLCASEGRPQQKQRTEIGFSVLLRW